MYEKELKIAISAVKKSEKTFRRYFGTKTQVTSKLGDYRNLVSLADKKIEAEIKKYLVDRYPAYGFVGEELGQKNAIADMVWVLDPIDGTTNYLHGLPDCTVALALLKKGKPILGVVAAPLLGRIYSAVAGQGAFLNGKKIKVAKIKNMRDAFGAYGWGKDPNFAVKNFPGLVKQTLKVRVAGSAALALCQVADGSFDFFYGKKIPFIWDYAAGQIILEEAGGKFVQDQASTKIVAANKSLAAKFSRL